MRQAILDLPKQFAWTPEVVHKEKLGKFQKLVVAGMGGSSWVAALIKARDPYFPVTIHRDYGLPPLPKNELWRTLFIASSYSGNTEEPIDAFEQALKKGLPLAAIAKGGKVLDIARKEKVPYIQIPDTQIQPRAASGFLIRGLLKIMNREDLLQESSELSKTLKPESFESQGKKLAKKIKGYVPIIYASTQNLGLAYVWKVKFNETGKIPAFYNVFPELNHNEMTGFDPALASKGGAGVKRSRKKLQEPFHFIFLKDRRDLPKIQKRMDVTKKLYEQRGLPVEVLELEGASSFYKIFSSFVLADWTSFYTAKLYSLEAEKVPMVEEMKSLLAPR
ncbi:MAG: glucose/mannose-6-phosphate isomerase [Parcubacteria group bacterium Gr01-1014_30]|nr:MAG: glucose/mannose-6-phosphate isomerase [Parcubacteria group bacterium Gr01-1014_30]